MAVSTPRKLWQHPDPDSTAMGRFRKELERASGQQLKVHIPDLGCVSIFTIY